MVGDRRSSRSGLDFRRDFFFAFGEAAGAQQAGVVAELLVSGYGFLVALQTSAGDLGSRSQCKGTCL